MEWAVTGTTTLEDGTTEPIEIAGVTMLRYAGGMITEEWGYFDSAQITNQLGGSEMPHAK